MPSYNHTEPNVNSALGLLLDEMLPRNTVNYENTGMFVEDSSLQPDVLITGPDRAPVVIEAKYESRLAVEKAAHDRLSLQETITNRPIETAIAVSYPETLRSVPNLSKSLESTALSYAMLYMGSERFPKSGWLKGLVKDIADMVRLSSVPQNAVNDAAQRLELGIDTAAKRLEEIAELRPRVADSVTRLLGLSNVVQTRRMACAIVANAMVFHDRVAGLHDEVKPLHLVCGDNVMNPQSELSDAWRDILKINYWPIFAVARDIINQMIPGDAQRIIRVLQQTAHDVSATGVGVSHDLTGRIFQSLIADRKYLATFYTLPASASLLARLAVDKMRGIDWADAEALSNLRVADFACGTGALLAAVYEQISTRHENAGSDSKNLHKAMMEEVLYGFDVMPSAIHISGATLSGVHPNVKFDGSRLYNMPFGRQRDGTVAIGSLEFLQTSAVMSQINTNDPARRTGSTGEETATNVIADAPDESFDMVIMNPPFTRATNHEGAHADVTNPAFAAFGATRADQTAMGTKINRLGKGSCYHGNAGIASAFAALAHQKLKKDGVLALVLPLTVAAGESWRAFREMIDCNYSEVSVFSIGANGRDASFSSDTGISECLVVARKLNEIHDPRSNSRFATLDCRPSGSVESNAIARAFSSLTDLRNIADGPYGGTPLFNENDLGGNVLEVSSPNAGRPWSSVRVADFSLVQTAEALLEARLHLPGHSDELKLPITDLTKIGNLGLVHRDITGTPDRGPFVKRRVSPTATYPALWNHNANAEKHILCEPDSQLIVRKGMEHKAAEVWSTASRSHVSLDFRFTSQPLASAITERETIGGTAWPNVAFADSRYDYAFGIWCNSTIGLLLYWWHSNRQQDGRSRATIRSIESMPVLDLRNLKDEQFEIAESIFEEFRDKELKPAYLADVDPNRFELDQRVICDLLGYDDATFRAVRRLTAKWCAEPSVHGGKERPKGLVFQG